MILEGLDCQLVTVTREHIQRMSRRELVEFIEFRGGACYDDESTALLRECALEDFDSENIPELF